MHRHVHANFMKIGMCHLPVPTWNWHVHVDAFCFLIKIVFDKQMIITCNFFISERSEDETYKNVIEIQKNTWIRLPLHTDVPKTVTYLVGVKYKYTFSTSFMFQYVIMNTPFRDVNPIMAGTGYIYPALWKIKNKHWRCEYFYRIFDDWVETCLCERVQHASAPGHQSSSCRQRGDSSWSVCNAGCRERGGVHSRGTADVVPRLLIQFFVVSAGWHTTVAPLAHSKGNLRPRWSGPPRWIQIRGEVAQENHPVPPTLVSHLNVHLRY